MFVDFKSVLNKKSILQLTLIKITFGLFAFLIIFISLYGDNYWEKQSLQQTYNLLLDASTTQSKVQSQIGYINVLKNDKHLTKSQLITTVQGIIQPLINLNKNASIGYYDLELALFLKNRVGLDDSFDNKVYSSLKYTNEIHNTSLDANVIYLPIYDKDNLVGYVLAYGQKYDYIMVAFQDASKIFILVLVLSILIIFTVQKYIKQIELCLDKFSEMIIKNDFDREPILTKLPELKPVLLKIVSFTEHLKQTNSELELSKLKINKILEGVSDGFYALDHDCNFTFVNHETRKLIIKEENIDLIGNSFWELFPQTVGSLNYEKIREAMSQKESVHWEAEGFTNMNLYYEYHAYPFKEGLTVFFRDITEIRQQKKEFERLERLNLIGQLAAGVSHEIRNPMTTVKGFLQIFGTKSKYAQEKENIDLMISEIDRANAIITDFLSLSKSSLDNIKLRNINEIIIKVLPMLQADAYNSNKEVIINLTVIPDIMINENEIKQIVLNLVRNGLDATPEQGHVIISTYSKDDKVVLVIKDQGTGIPQAIQEKIGTPFFTTKDNGTGLGLAISIGIAQRHNAIFKFETGNGGTIFYTLFPTYHQMTYTPV